MGIFNFIFCLIICSLGWSVLDYIIPKIKDYIDKKRGKKK